MKTISLLILIMLLSFLALAAPKITAVQNNGQWNNPTSWNLNRIPQNGDTIVIPSGINIFISNMINLNGAYIRINGVINITGGKLDLDVNSTIVVFLGGSIIGITNGDQIRIGSVHKFKGGGAPITGPAYSNSGTGTYPSGFSPFGGLLPVRFLSFYVKKSVSSVQLSWSTTEEKNNSHFEIERSSDGRNFKNIAVIFANSGSELINMYQFTDKITVTGTIYYRLKQVDRDGNYMYSIVKIVYANEAGPQSSIYASGRKTVFIEFNEQLKSKMVVRVFKSNGQAVHEMIIKEVAYRHEIPLPMLSSGIYIIHLTDEKLITQVQKVVF